MSALRGPAKNVEVLAHSYSLYVKENEPMIMVNPYGKGMIVHMPMGHYNDEREPYGEAVYCVGFQTLLARSTEFAASGKVTIGVPDPFPSKEKASVVAVNELEWPGSE